MGKLAVLARVARRNPSEAWERAWMAASARVHRKLDAPGSYAAVPPKAAPQALESTIDVSPFMDEAALDEIGEQVRTDSASHAGPFKLKHNADLALGRMAYLLVRAHRPNVVLETGVAYGVTTAFILRALEVNGHGSLHSIDLPPLVQDADRFVGVLVPHDLRPRWHLHRGSVRRLLSQVLRSVGTVDMFVHDSLHTRKHMAWELNTVMPYLGKGAVVLVDDVHRNIAFDEWVHTSPTQLSLTMHTPEKGGIAGIALMP